LECWNVDFAEPLTPHGVCSDIGKYSGKKIETM